MRKKFQRIVVILLAAALLLTVLMPVISIFAQASTTITQEDLDALQAQIDEIAAQRKDVEAELATIRNDLSKAKEAVELAQQNVLLAEQAIAFTQQQIDISQSILDELDLRIEEKEYEIMELEAQEATQREEFYRQVRWMEETGGVSYLSILFQASTFSELLDYAMLITDIMDYTNRIIDRLEGTQADLADVRNALQADWDAEAEVQAQLEDQKAQQEELRAELEEERAKAVALMEEIAATESEYAKEAAKLAAAERESNAALKRAEQEYAIQIAALNNTGVWYWPLPGRYGISSIFGSRYIFGHWESHTGTDIPAPNGTEIRAAQGGIVTYVSPNNLTSYGWYCMISHGNGYVTLYAHQNQRPIVKEGQLVEKGQVIGYVGSTGNSTGYHLHFELRINGVRNDILQLYPNLTFTGYGTSWTGNNYPPGMR